jgi:uncharacterized protein YacL
MTPLLTINLFRVLFVAFTTVVGVMVAEGWWSPWLGGAAGAVFGLCIVLADRLLKGVSLRLFSSASFGLLMGVIFSRLLLASDVLRDVRPDIKWIVGLAVYAACAYLGTMLAVRSNRQDFSLIIPYVRFRESAGQESPVIIDSNIIVDGRVAEICATGFLSSTLVVPRFILEELHRLADSAEPLKRERGKRALERLQQMQQDDSLNVSVPETEVEGEQSTDSKLIQLARMLDARLLTNDANLCSIARLQGVRALNLNELARVVRPVLATGDEVELTLTKEGREPHQAVGYLPDGTMIVVNQGRDHLGKNVLVAISSVLQTSGGRLFFAELRH